MRWIWLLSSLMYLFPGFTIVASTNNITRIIELKKAVTLGIPPIYTKCPEDWKKFDFNASLARDAEGRLWLILPRGGVQGKPEFHSWGIFRGTTMDNLEKQFDTNPSMSSFPKPYGNDIYWAGGLWIDEKEGVWHSPVHVEFNFQKFGKNSLSFQRRIGLATSRDQGKTWKYEGDILTADNPYDPHAYEGKTYFEQGCGDQQLYYDDKYFYLYFMDAWVERGNPGWRRYMAVRAARCAKADKMAPGKWQKWYNGAWVEPGVGGHCSDVFNWGGTETACVFFSSFLGKYCALVSGGNGGVESGGPDDEPDLFFSTCMDLNRQDWSTPLKIASAGINGYYNWAVDKTTSSRIRIDGDSFRYYTSDGGRVRWFDVKFCETDPKAMVEILPPVYPKEPVSDYVPGWDPVHCPVAK